MRDKRLPHHSPPPRASRPLTARLSLPAEQAFGNSLRVQDDLGAISHRRMLFQIHIPFSVFFPSIGNFSDLCHQTNFGL